MNNMFTDTIIIYFGYGNIGIEYDVPLFAYYGTITFYKLIPAKNPGDKVYEHDLSDENMISMIKIDCHQASRIVNQLSEISETSDCKQIHVNDTLVLDFSKYSEKSKKIVMSAFDKIAVTHYLLMAT